MIFRRTQSRPKAILFDWDNTLVDTSHVIHEALNVALTALGMDPFDKAKYDKQPHLSLRDAGPKLFGERWEEGERIFYNAVEACHLERLRVLEGAHDVLAYLGSLGIYLGVVSNKNGHILRREAEHLGWTGFFKKIIGSRDTEADKPSPIPVKAALPSIKKILSKDVWFVGDSIVDVHCALASGCLPVVVGEGEAAKAQDILYAKDCQGLAQIITNL